MTIPGLQTNKEGFNKTDQTDTHMVGDRKGGTLAALYREGELWMVSMKDGRSGLSMDRVFVWERAMDCV